MDVSQKLFSVILEVDIRPLIYLLLLFIKGLTFFNEKHDLLSD
tara:strand:+ start:934 stop:1062 length:129 start_codon:yes stop_codon:yes gene_type:complete